MAQQLRPYQEAALERIRYRYSQGTKRVLLHMPTGSGKTVVFCEIFAGMIKKGRRGIMAVKGKALVDQASQRLFREGIPHGCLQGTHWNHNPGAPIQICSIDTLYRRKVAPQADMVVIDEAHFATSDSFRWFVAQYPEAFFLPVTATPYVKDGLRHIADEVVRPISFRDLVSQGYLRPPRYFAPTSVNLADVRIDRKTSDYEARGLASAVSQPNIFGDIVRYFREIGQLQPALCFAVSVEHSRALVEKFAASGIPAAHMEADTPDAERTAILRDLATGKIRVVCNVGILCTGVDLPWLRVVIMARPTKSYNLYIQQLGRGTRPFEGKENFVVLDHANNINEHGFMEDERECDLDGDGAPKAPPVKICKACFVAFNPRACKNVCPECGHDHGPLEEPVGGGGSTRKVEADERVALEELRVQTMEPAQLAQVKRAILKLAKTAAMKGYKPGFVFHRIKEQFNVHIANAKWAEIKEAYDEFRKSFGGPLDPSQ